MNATSDAPGGSNQRNKILDFDKFLPYGETLRGYLEQTFVKTTDLSELLRSRGVFVQDATKEDLVPILAATLISPSEFETLLECRKERDSKEKVINRTRVWKSSRSLLEAANNAVRLDNLPFESTPKCKLLGKPTIKSVDGDAEHIELDFTIQRTRLSTDWCKEESQFSGKINLKKMVIEGKIVLSITHTSPETKDIAERYARLIEESLRNSNDIGDPSAEDRILFSSFDNTERADFFWSLTAQCNHDELKFAKLTNLEALTDKAGREIPDNCKDLIQGFEQLRLRGQLHESAYCQKREIYPFVRFYRMDARYKFKIVGAEGECVIRYEFADYGVSEDKNAEFTQQVEIASLSDKSRNISKAELKKPLQELVARNVRERFIKAREVEEPAPVTPPPKKTRARRVSDVEQTDTLFDLKTVDQSRETSM